MKLLVYTTKFSVCIDSIDVLQVLCLEHQEAS